MLGAKRRETMPDIGDPEREQETRTKAAAKDVKDGRGATETKTRLPVMKAFDRSITPAHELVGLPTK